MAVFNFKTKQVTMVESQIWNKGDECPPLERAIDTGLSLSEYQGLSEDDITDVEGVMLATIEEFEIMNHSAIVKAFEEEDVMLKELYTHFTKYPLLLRMVKISPEESIRRHIVKQKKLVFDSAAMFGVGATMATEDSYPINHYIYDIGDDSYDIEVSHPNFIVTEVLEV